jgi:hypothetical protein
VLEIHTNGVRKFLDLLEIIERSESISSKTVDDLLSDYTWQQFISSYERMEDFSRTALKKILLNLTKAETIGEGFVLPKLEAGFRALLDQNERNQLRTRLVEADQLNLDEALQIALKYLPKETPLEVHVHFTIDAFNTGMFFENHVFFDLCRVDPTQINMQYLSHEFHHTGAHYWFKQNQVLQKLTSSEDLRLKLLARTLEYLVSEGLANGYCTPFFVQGDQPRVIELRSQRNKWFQHLVNLLSELLKDTGSPEVAQKLFNQFTLDPEAGLPPGHNLSGTMILEMDSSSEVPQKQIINLVKTPEHFFELYNRATETSKHEPFPSTIIKRLKSILE